MSQMFVSGFPSGSVVKNQPAMQETQVGSLGQADSLEKEESIVFLRLRVLDG